MNKLLVICGPTATGKTSLALNLAKKFDGELISADSRQVYRGMNIGTGKDLPSNAKLQMPNYKLRIGNLKLGFYVIKDVLVWGYDLVDPKSEFSVGQYITLANRIISDIQSRGKLPILVGGTGLYIKGIVDGIPTAQVAKNTKLRSSLDNKKTDELFEILSKLDPIKSASLNTSDRKNPRRLVRAIEVAEFFKSQKIKDNFSQKSYDLLFIGLKVDKDSLRKRIIERVKQRLKAGLIDEIEELLNNGVTWSMQSMNTISYKEWKEYFDGAINAESVKEKWIGNENKYAKRQMVWFKKDKRINWFNPDSKVDKQRMAKLAEKWYKI